MGEELLTVQQVMDIIKVADETVYRYIRTGKLKAVRVGGLWRVPQSALDEFLQQDQALIRSHHDVPGKAVEEV